jgi:hypothetical protein
MSYTSKSKRSIRRHHRARLKKKRKYYWNYTDNDPMPEKYRSYVINTPHPCSRYCCGNPRKHFNARTHQEELEYQRDIDSEVDNYYNSKGAPMSDRPRCSLCDNRSNIKLVVEGEDTPDSSYFCHNCFSFQVMPQHPDGLPPDVRIVDLDSPSEE